MVALLFPFRDASKSTESVCKRVIVSFAVLLFLLATLSPSVVLAKEAPGLTDGQKEKVSHHTKAAAKDAKSSSMTQLRFVIYSVSCLACVRKIERHLRQTEGVSSIDIKMGLNPVFAVDYNAKKVKEDVLIQIVDKEGYRYEKLDAQTH